MKKFTADVTVNKTKLPIIESPHAYVCAREALDKALSTLHSYQPNVGWALVGFKDVEGAEMAFDVHVVLKCAMNRRAPKRAPEVIAQEKAAEKAKKQARDEQKRQAEEQAAQMRKAKRRRIMQQIDHAFQTGHELGSEPVAKYITCDTCSSPADFLYVNTPLAPVPPCWTRARLRTLCALNTTDS